MNNINSSDFLSIISNEIQQFIVFWDKETEKNVTKIKSLINNNNSNIHFLEIDSNEKNLELCNHLEIDSFIIYAFQSGNWTRFKYKDFTDVQLKKFFGLNKIK